MTRVVTLGELTSTLANELGQPFTAILANAAATPHIPRAPEPDLAEVRGTLADISKDAERGRSDSPAPPCSSVTRPGFATVELNYLIHAVGRIVHSDAVRHGVTLQLDLAPGAVPVTGDGVQLQQVMLNLCSTHSAPWTHPNTLCGDWSCAPG